MPSRLKAPICSKSALICFVLAAAISSVPIGIAKATLIQETYTAFVQRMLRSFDEVTQTNELSKDQERLVRRLSALWFFEGPCKGNADLTSELRDGITAAFVPNLEPKRRVDRAALEILGLLIRENLGRPNEVVCRFALETAIPEIKLQPKACLTAECRK